MYNFYSSMGLADFYFSWIFFNDFFDADKNEYFITVNRWKNTWLNFSWNKMKEFPSLTQWKYSKSVSPVSKRFNSLTTSARLGMIIIHYQSYLIVSNQKKSICARVNLLDTIKRHNAFTLKSLKVILPLLRLDALHSDDITRLHIHG